MLAGGGFAWAWRPTAARPRRWVVQTVATAVILTLAGLTWQQVQVWRNSVSLWTHAVSVDPSSPVVANNLMVALLAEGRVAEAHAHFKRTIQDVRGQKRVRWFFTLAIALQKSGDLEGAAGYYREVISLDPNHEEAWNNLGVIYATRGEFSQALAAFLRALAINPRYDAACKNGRRLAEIAGTSHPILEQCGEQAN